MELSDKNRLVLPQTCLDHVKLVICNSSVPMCFYIPQIGDRGLDLLWRFLHIVVSLFHIVSGIFEAIQSYAISLGLIQKYSSIDIEKLRCLAVVVDIEVARDVAKVVELLQWLKTIGVKQVGLFDSQGKDAFIKSSLIVPS